VRRFACYAPNRPHLGADLSLPIVTEKDLLPAIIVTPSSPTHETDFSIAFLAPPTPPSALERLRAKVCATFARRAPICLSPTTPVKRPSPARRARVVLFVALLLFILLAHVLTRGFAAARPQLSFGVEAAGTPANTSGAVVSGSGLARIFDFQWFLAGAPVEEEKRDFIVDAFKRR
jgi:hypothetical protein